MAAPKSADVCRNDLKAFNGQMEKDGYWYAGEGYGFGYPMGVAGLGIYGGFPRAFKTVPLLLGGATTVRGLAIRCASSSPLRTSSRGKDNRSPARPYSRQPVEFTSAICPMCNTMASRSGRYAWLAPTMIATAVPVIGSNVAFRSDELIGVEVRSPDGVALGSVDDLVLSPETGKLAYLVIARGGIFGFDETRIPIPWDDFKATPNASLLVLDTTKTALDAAPKVEKNSFSISGEVGSESQKVDAYWKANQPSKAVN